MFKIVFFGILVVAFLCFLQANGKAFNDDKESDSFRHGHGDMPPPPGGFNGEFKLLNFILT